MNINEGIVGAYLTDTQKNFLEHEVAPEYIFYSKKEHYAYCGYCNTEFDPKELGTTKPLMKKKCPKCNKLMTLKAKGQNKTWTDSKGIGLILSKAENNMICLRYFDVQRLYKSNPKEQTIYYRECMREFFNDTGFYSCWDRKHDQKEFVRCNIYPTASYKRPANEPAIHVNIWYTDNRNIFTRNIKSVTKGTRFYNSFFSEFCKKADKKFWDIYKLYLREVGDDNNFHEYMWKSGFGDMIVQRDSTNQNHFKVNLSKKTLPQMMLLTKPQYKELLKMNNPTENDVIKYQIMNTYKLKSLDEVNLFKKYFGTYYQYSTLGIDQYEVNEFHKLFKFSLYKFDKYITEHKTNSRTYLDYLNMCNKLSYDLNNDFVVFPKDLKKAHDAAVDLYNIQKNQLEIDRATKLTEYLNMVQKYIQLFSFNNSELEIMIPKNCGEIALEGQKLRHCVGTYVDKVNKGKSVILFIRKKSEPNIPYYTMEVVNNEVTQVYGYRDKNCEKNVFDFVNIFANEKHLVINNRVRAIA